MEKVKFAFCYLLLFLVFDLAKAQTIVNGYAKVSSIAGTTINFDAGNIDVSNDNFVVSGRAIIMQMKDNVIGNTTNTSNFGDIGSIQSAGLYEVVTLTAVTPTSVTIASSLQNAYNLGANSVVQLITYPLLGGGGDYTTTDDIIALDWNGNIGGVVAFRVGGTLNLLHSILADGAGFRGGAQNFGGAAGCSPGTYVSGTAANFANKGEGIYLNTNTGFVAARGKMVSGGGGGNSHNAGGGGGSNYSAGGQGGPGWRDGSPSTDVGDWYCNPGAGGLGGAALSSYISPSRIFMGGGGGAGEGNNNGATAGGNGGGIILLTANTLATDNSCGGVVISANGDGGLDPTPANDGAGGAGAAGSIVMNVQSYSINAACALTIRANGGNGGDINTNGIHGGGGGGGMGVAIFSTPVPSTNVTVTTNPGVGGANNDGTDSGDPNYPGPADPGGGTTGAGEGVSQGNSPLPVQLTDFWGGTEGSYNVLKWKTASEINNDYFEVQLSRDGQTFVAVGKVDGAGTTNEAQYYEFSHYNQFGGLLYYRLKQVDFDGSFEFSRTIFVDADGADINLAANVFPNPSGGQDVKLQLYSGNTKEDFYISVYDLLGKKIESFSVRNTEMDVNGISLHTSSFAKGVYSIEILQGHNKVIKKLVVD